MVSFCPKLQIYRYNTFLYFLCHALERNVRIGSEIRDRDEDCQMANSELESEESRERERKAMLRAASCHVHTLLMLNCFGLPGSLWVVTCFWLLGVPQQEVSRRDLVTATHINKQG